MAVVELSAGEMITGASRLVAGILQLLLLGFGIVDAAQVVGLPSADALVDTPTDQLGWWAPWVGVLLVGIGNYLYFSAPGGSLGRLLLVLYAAWIGQCLGDQALGGYLSGFVGASVMTPVAYIPERRPSGPPALVSFLPAFSLLVPGALGLIGVAEYLGQDPSLGCRTSSATSARWWPSALASSAAIRSTARWHGHLAGFRNSDPAGGGPRCLIGPVRSRQEPGCAGRPQQCTRA